MLPCSNRLNYNPPVPDPPASPINARTRYCAVYGHPVRHSASPAMQNAGITQLGLNWRYLACDVDPGQLREAIFGAQTMGFIGLNLTVPHKILAVDMVDVVDPTAKRWGAVNTIRFEARTNSGDWVPVGQLEDSAPEKTRSVGFNTDANAIIRSINEDLGFQPQGTHVLLLGAGGAGRAAALRMASEKPTSLTLINRTRSKAEEIANEIRAKHPDLQIGFDYPESAVDLILNATSLGLKPDDAMPINEDWMRTHKPGFVYDMIYRPAETLLLKTARDLGSRTANGIGMLLHQGADALEIWSGKTAPRDIMRAALEHNIYG